MRLTLPLAALLLSTNLAMAADPAPADAPPDLAKLALAADILEATHAMANMTRVVADMTPQIVADLKKNRPDLTDETLVMFGDMFKQELTTELPDVLKLEAEIYSDHFTLEELQYLQKFYASALGRKLVAETPRIMTDLVPVSLSWGQHAGQVAMARVVEQMKAKGVDIAGVKK